MIGKEEMGGEGVRGGDGEDGDGEPILFEC